MVLAVPKNIFREHLSMLTGVPGLSSRLYFAQAERNKTHEIFNLQNDLYGGGIGQIEKVTVELK